jgi:hypothetical protein
MSLPSQAALTHLRTIKANDGWSVKKDDKGLKLCRRSVALTDNSFLDIHFCPKQNLVVGVLTKNASACQVLVNASGQPISNRRLVSCQDTYDPNHVSRNVNFQASRREAEISSTSTSTLSPEQNQQILQYAFLAIAATIVIRILSSSLVMIYFILGPMFYLYAAQTCPRMSDFDAKKELKRVLRGHHLPENHPEKPKGFLEDLAARVAASVTTELVTLPGYEVSMMPIVGAAIWVDLIVPTANTQHYWVGAFGKWHYVYSRHGS